MTFNMQVIITMAGSGQPYQKAGFKSPKPLVDVAGQKMMDWVLQVFPTDWKIILACNPEVFDQLKVAGFQNKNVQVALVKPTARGPLDTVIQVLDLVNMTKPIIVSYCDYTMLWNPNAFLQMAQLQVADAAIVSFKGFHPTYFGPNSYCHLQVENNSVIELQEKKLYTDSLFQEWTSCGLYYFKSAHYMNRCFDEQIAKNLKHSGGEFYTSLAIKAMMLKEKTKVLNYGSSRSLGENLSVFS